jgi:hypothetical protein
MSHRHHRRHVLDRHLATTVPQGDQIRGVLLELAIIADVACLEGSVFGAYIEEAALRVAGLITGRSDPSETT